MKTCRVCRQAKPDSYFYRAAENEVPGQAICRKCRRRATREAVARDDDDKTKLCPACNTWKAPSEFGPNRSRHDGRQVYCRSCWSTKTKGYYANGRAHDTVMTKVYRLSRGGYAAMAEAQEHRCAICGEQETAKLGETVKRLAVDHDHRTNEVRALLCSRCNTILGRADDSVELLQACISYLRRYQRRRDQETFST